MRATREAVLVWLGALVAIAATSRLGFWQLDRAAQKTAAARQQLAQRQLPPLSGSELGRTPEAAAQQLYRSVRVSGRWLGPVVFLDNQPHDGRIGFLALAPLLLGERDAVLVQRGWSPRDPADRSRVLPLPPSDAPVTLDATVAPWPSQRLALGGNDTGTIRQNVDPDTLQREWRVELRPLSLLEAPSDATRGDGWIRQWPAPVADVGKHHGYALQWFSLAALVAGLTVWFRLIKPRRRQ